MKKRWITGEEILDRWQGLDFELANAFLHGYDVDWERTVRIDPYSQIDGRKPCTLCMACEYGTYDGWPGEHHFQGTHEHSCSPEPAVNCCHVALPLNVLAAKLKEQFFLLSEVEEYERLAGIVVNNNEDNVELSIGTEQVNENGLSPEERQELGRLRLEKEKWDRSIKASMVVGQSLTPGKRFTKEELWKILEKSGIQRNDLPNTVFNQIWASIPTEFRNIGGRPKTGDAVDF
jgi:hypothetical protein